MRNSLKLAVTLLAVTATTASAQGRGRNIDGVPPGMRPSAGMCRVWVNGVPPGQQSGVTDCATALAQVRPNSRVIYGSNTSNILNRTSTRRRDGDDINKDQRKAAKRSLKAHQKAEKRELKDRDDDLDNGAMKAAREDLKDHQSMEREHVKGNEGGKGKGKH